MKLNQNIRWIIFYQVVQAMSGLARLTSAALCRGCNGSTYRATHALTNPNGAKKLLVQNSLIVAAPFPGDSVMLFVYFISAPVFVT